LAEALRFADEGSTTGGLLTHAALKTLAAGCRELNAARAEITEWRILNGWGGTPEIINDFIKGQQTRIHHAQDLETELAAVRAEIDGLNFALKQASSIYDAVTEQRDRLAEALTKIQGVGLTAVDAFDELDRIDEIVDEALKPLNTNKSDQERKSPASECSR
jgi:multidrug efflux pump subunit AcrA (membrane-fusion protein)